jgi:hypothetical protein
VRNALDNGKDRSGGQDYTFITICKIRFPFEDKNMLILILVDVLYHSVKMISEDFKNRISSVRLVKRCPNNIAFAGRVFSPSFHPALGEHYFA